MRVSLPIISLAGSLLLAATAAAQMGPEPTFMLSGPGPMMQIRTDGMGDVGNDVSPVKGLPFCATVNTEHTQMLADNNRIHTTNNANLCRDSEGRTRREASLNLMGAAPQTSAPKLITIVDPVAGFRYVLDTEHKIAHKMPLKPGFPDGGPGTAAKGDHVMIYQRTGSGGPNLVFKDVVVNKTADSADPAPATESLGDQSINGIHATGTRITTTIPAGKMGNEKPITVTSERWYSPELQVTVMTKHNDPWAGEIKSEFTNVSTSEPDASLFAVPSDYKIEDDKDGPMKVQFFRHGAPPPAQ